MSWISFNSLRNLVLIFQVLFATVVSIAIMARAYFIHGRITRDLTLENEEHFYSRPYFGRRLDHKEVYRRHLKIYYEKKVIDGRQIIRPVDKKWSISYLSGLFGLLVMRFAFLSDDSKFLIGNNN